MGQLELQDLWDSVGLLTQQSRMDLSLLNLHVLSNSQQILTYRACFLLSVRGRLLMFLSLMSKFVLIG